METLSYQKMLRKEMKGFFNKDGAHSGRRSLHLTGLWVINDGYVDSHYFPNDLYISRGRGDSKNCFPSSLVLKHLRWPMGFWTKQCTKGGALSACLVLRHAFHFRGVFWKASKSVSHLQSKQYKVVVECLLYQHRCWLTSFNKWRIFLTWSLIESINHTRLCSSCRLSLPQQLR